MIPTCEDRGATRYPDGRTDRGARSTGLRGRLTPPATRSDLIRFMPAEAARSRSVPAEAPREATGGPIVSIATDGATPAADAGTVDDPLVVADVPLRSRLILGTGKFPSNHALRAAIDAAATEVVTVALRRVDLDDDAPDDILDAIDRDRVRLLPNTSGAADADEAVRLSRLARAAGMGDWVKLEVTPDPRHLLPDPIDTLRAAERLVADGAVVLPYCQADPLLCRQLEEVGCATVMPLGSWIGSNRGVRTRDAIEMIVEQSSVPVVVDAGLGAPSHAAEAMEIGADAVLVNTAIAVAGDPVGMARAFALGTRAGRQAFLAGTAPAGGRARASSPLTGFLEERA